MSRRYERSGEADAHPETRDSRLILRGADDAVDSRLEPAGGREGENVGGLSREKRVSDT